MLQIIQVDLNIVCCFGSWFVDGCWIYYMFDVDSEWCGLMVYDLDI